MQNIKKLVILSILPLILFNIVVSEGSNNSINKKLQPIDLQNKMQDPNSLAEEYFNIGKSLYKLGKYEEAIKNYNLAIKYKPDCAKFYNSKGITLNTLKQYQEAIDNYDLTIRYDSSFAEAYNNKANVFCTIG